jgi:hypothetical protein
VKLVCPVKYTVVVDASNRRTTGVVREGVDGGSPGLGRERADLLAAESPPVPETSEMVAMTTLFVDSTPEFANTATPDTSQSQAVRETLAALTVVPLVYPEVVTAVVALTYSPTLPACTELFVVVPTIPTVCDG